MSDPSIKRKAQGHSSKSFSARIKIEPSVNPIYKRVKEVAASSLLRKNGGNAIPLFKTVHLPKSFAVPASTSSSSPSSPGATSIPLEVFLRIRRGDHSFLIEGVKEALYRQRYVVMGTEPYSVVPTTDSDPFDTLEPELLKWKAIHLPEVETDARFADVKDIPFAMCGAVGHIGYDCVRHFEPRLKPHFEHQTNPIGAPESAFMFVNSLVAYDHQRKCCHIVALCALDGDLVANYKAAKARILELEARLDVEASEVARPSDDFTERAPAVSNTGADGYKSMVRTLKENIVAGEMLQAVPSQRLAQPTTVHPFTIYEVLRELNPSPYMFYCDMGGWQIVGASPECLLRVESSGRMTNHPIAGTRPRGKTPAEDRLNEQELLGDEKERAEHIMLVDLGRNDVNRVCEPTSTQVEALMVVERYSHVMHIVSRVAGTLRPDQSSLDAFRSVFPAGTTSGAPKIRAMELVASLEKERRGLYAGAFGYFSFDGSTTDTCIALRTMIFRDGKAYMQAGGGIVFDSQEQAEYEETIHKMNALVKALQRCEQEQDEKRKADDGTTAASSPAYSVKRADMSGLLSSSPSVPWTGQAHSVEAGSHWGLRAQAAAPEDGDDATVASNAAALSSAAHAGLISHAAPQADDLAGVIHGVTVLLIDNYDSFTFNLYQYFRFLGATVIVKRNDEITLAEADEINPTHLVISPGPSHPRNAGISSKMITHFAGRIPVLGVCLGHQAMVELYGGKVGVCDETKHGKLSTLQHDGKGLFASLPPQVTIVRYHSLTAFEEDMPDCLIVSARSEKGHIMGIRHKELMVEGLQFHPESIKTEEGHRMMRNFLLQEGGTQPVSVKYCINKLVRATASGNNKSHPAVKPRSAASSPSLASINSKSNNDIPTKPEDTVSPAAAAAVADIDGGLTPREGTDALREIMTGRTPAVQVAAFLALQPITSISPELLHAYSKVLLDYASPCRLDGNTGRPLVDIVGTGGDGKDAFNVSTAAGFIVAACGGKVAKHGNRSSSGSCGSADFLEALGINIELGGAQLGPVIDACSFGFLFAQKFHSAMRHVGAARKQLGIRTLFNLCGPLSNPTRPKYQVIGVAQASLGPVFAEILALRGAERGWVVHSHDGLDELSCESDTDVWEVLNGEITHRIVGPKDFGLESHPLDLVCGGTAAERAAAFNRILGIDVKPVDDKVAASDRALTDFIIMNAAAAVYVAGLAPDLIVAAKMARQAILSGHAATVLTEYTTLTRAATEPTSILARICAQRRVDMITASGRIPLDDLRLQVNHAPPTIDVVSRLRQAGSVAVMAEVKRASPSRGDIAPHVNAPRQAMIYAQAGAALISVLCEPRWFKGTMQDMREVRQALGSHFGTESRPAVLCKDFIQDEYHIHLARVHGADAVLLIVASIDSDVRLRELASSAISLGMTPLFEAANPKELKRALSCNAKFIGINNRNLHTFDVDMATTGNVISDIDIPQDVVLAALSGISSRSDVAAYERIGVKAVLVGQALMESANPAAKVRELLGRPHPPYVKICGVKNVADATAALLAGADMIGVVFAPGSKRRVDVATAKEIISTVRRLSRNNVRNSGLTISEAMAAAAEEDADDLMSSLSQASMHASSIQPSATTPAAVDGDQPIKGGGISSEKWYSSWAYRLERLMQQYKPLIVGVFADQDPAEVQRIADEVQLDVVQLSGDEGFDAASFHNLTRPVFKAVHVGKGENASSVMSRVQPGQACAVLLDTASATARGGTGRAFDWSVAAGVQSSIPVFLAGGLNTSNVAEAVDAVAPFAVDVSSGVETNGRKDHDKIRAFVHMAKFTSETIKKRLAPIDDNTLYGSASLTQRGYNFGRFGDFGGRYVAETLHGALEDLERMYKAAMRDPSFHAEVKQLAEAYVGRETPLYFAQRLTEDCGGARIWLKREDLCHTGAHKINNALAQAILAKRLGKPRIIAETGAGQHGVATATACALLGLECVVYMGAEDCRRQSLNVFRMKNLGATVVGVEAGSKTLKDAINEAMRDWVSNVRTTHYLVGSAIGPHPFPVMVRDFQSVIGHEAKKQILLQAGKLPDAVVACVGGGSNAIGLFHPFIHEPTRIVGVEAAGAGITTSQHSATCVAGRTGVLHGTKTLLLQDSHGQVQETHSISAGLDYPGVGPEHAYLKTSKRGEYVAVDDKQAMEGFTSLSKLEGIVPALESSHAIYAAMQMAKRMPAHEDIVVCLSGRGDKDMNTVASIHGVSLDGSLVQKGF